ncbi:class I SAM-dependent methyltransferase [Litoribacter ruber]|uniref:class I SAM-dependent methyltransferase n=1 Tax=Litoribacter ruber TaxID=702568 RepID=UPI001BDB11AB|nr:class I SAM-dependent methyltransferase [Litoribacter ruber]MBT0813041.1 class I SAM-dependent methyltransferase [Litoribacter ruber]
MIKKLLKDSVFHVQYWYFRECWRTIKEQKSLGKVLRYYPQYMKSNLDYSKSPLVLGVPWITFEAIEYLQSLIKSDFKVFEFGSGGSTRFFSERTSEVYSVEHDEGWFKLVSNKLGSHSNLRLYFEPGIVPKTGMGIQIKDEDGGNFNFKDYVETILEFEDDFFDLILIDGKARNISILNALPKLKKGGYLVVDNSNRKSYAETLSKIENWMLLKSFGPSLSSKRFTQTSFYRKPIDEI